MLATRCPVAAEPDGEVIGFITLREGWIDHLYIDPGRARLGLRVADARS
jgi:hypothetical protein